MSSTLKQFSQHCKIIKVKAATAVGTTDVTTEAVDMAQDSGWGGICFISTYGTPAVDNKPHAEQSTDNSAWSDLAGTELAPGASDATLFLEIGYPHERYQRSVWQRGTSSTLGEVYAILFNPRQVPFTGQAVGEVHMSPAVVTK